MVWDGLAHRFPTHVVNQIRRELDIERLMLKTTTCRSFAIH